MHAKFNVIYDYPIHLWLFYHNQNTKLCILGKCCKNVFHLARILIRLRDVFVRCFHVGIYKWLRQTSQNFSIGRFFSSPIEWVWCTRCDQSNWKLKWNLHSTCRSLLSRVTLQMMKELLWSEGGTWQGLKTTPCTVYTANNVSLSFLQFVFVIKFR